MEIRKKESKGSSFKRLVGKLFTNSHSSEERQAPVKEESIEKYKNTPYTAEEIFDLFWFASNRNIIPSQLLPPNR